MIEIKEVKNIGKQKIDSIEGDFYYIPIVNGVEGCYVAETYDIALLLGLQIKYDRTNSQFARMACRMLNIDSEWSV